MMNGSTNKPDKKRLGELLLEIGVVTEADMPKGLEYAQKASENDYQSVPRAKQLMDEQGLPVATALRALSLSKQRRCSFDMALAEVGWRPRPVNEEPPAPRASSFNVAELDSIGLRSASISDTSSSAELVQSADVNIATEPVRAYDLSELDAIGSGGNKQASLLEPAPAPPTEPVRAYDLSELDAIGSGGNKQAFLPEPAPAPPTEPVRAYDLSELDAIGAPAIPPATEALSANWDSSQLDAIEAPLVGEPVRPASGSNSGIGNLFKSRSNNVEKSEPGGLGLGTYNRLPEPESPPVSSGRPYNLEELEALGRLSGSTEAVATPCQFDPSELDSIGMKPAPPPPATNTSGLNAALFKPADAESAKKSNRISLGAFGKKSDLEPGTADAAPAREVQMLGESSLTAEELAALSAIGTPSIPASPAEASEIPSQSQSLELNSVSSQNTSPLPVEPLSEPKSPAKSSPLNKLSGLTNMLGSLFNKSKKQDIQSADESLVEALPEEKDVQAIQPQTPSRPEFEQYLPLSQDSVSEIPVDLELRADLELSPKFESLPRFEASAAPLEIASPLDIESPNIETPADIEAPPNFEPPANIVLPANLESSPDLVDDAVAIGSLPIEVGVASAASPPSARTPGASLPVELQRAVATGDELMQTGNCEPAAMFYAQAMDFLDGSAASEPLDVADILVKSAIAALHLKDFGKSEANLCRALNIRQNVLGQEDIAVADCLDRLAELYDVQSQFLEAERYYLGALGIKERLLSTSNSEVTRSLKKLVAVSKRRGAQPEGKLYGELLTEAGIVDSHRVGEALNLAQERAVPIGRALISLNYLTEDDFRAVLQAQLLIREGAVPGYLAVRALRLCSQQQISFEESLREIGLDCQEHISGNAFDLLRVADELVVAERELAPQDPGIAALCIKLGDLYMDHLRYEQAEVLYKRAVAIREELLESDRVGFAEALGRLADLNYRMEKNAQAEQMYLRLLDIWEAESGTEEINFANTLECLAATCYVQGNYKEAGRRYQLAINTKKNLLGVKHPGLVPAIQGRANCYFGDGRYAESEQTYRDALEILEQVYGSDNEQTSAVCSVLGDVIYSQGRLEEAQQWYNRALDSLSNCSNPDVITFAGILEKLAHCAFERGDLERSDVFYRHFIQTRERSGTDQASDVVDALERYAVVLDQMDRSEQAAKIRQAAATTRQAIGC